MPRTLRQTMAAALARQPLSAAQLADMLELRIPEVEGHLEHLCRSHRRAWRMEPARCLDCDYVFGRRGRLDAPGRCPVCKGQRVAGPWFSLADPGRPGD